MRLNQVTVAATDMSASRAFYELLGFQVIVDDAPHYMRFLCPDGTATFSLHETQAPPRGDGPSIYFEFDSAEALDDRVTQLKARGVAFESGPVDQTWLWREAWTVDPTGNRLCLYYAGRNRLDPPWRVRVKDT